VFAETEWTPEGVKAFADRFGSLGGDVASLIQIQPDVHRPSYLSQREPRRKWADEIATMRAAVRLWEYARHDDAEGLSGLGLRWRGETGIEINPGPEAARDEPGLPHTWIASTHLGDDVLARFVPGDLVSPALHHVQRTVNDKMERRASPRLLWTEGRSQLGMRLVPGSLIGALWLQFARAIERDNEFRQCAECGIWFELSPQTARSHKQFCSNACRTKAYRKRQAEAARLHAEGQSIEDIAGALESEPDTVRGWIARKLGSGDPPQSGAG